MQSEVAAERARLEEQHGLPPRAAPGLPRAAQQIGSMFGSMRNAFAAGANQRSALQDPGRVPCGSQGGEAEVEVEPRLPPAAARMPVRNITILVQWRSTLVAVFACGSMLGVLLCLQHWCRLRRLEN